ncbi:hypothetical protein DL98DRAFT_525607 [Cadophora sp. DSE1049]|nr:hypothetical protein DL98DRAFT_525607 [Cadophora sp. DSE1049]
MVANTQEFKSFATTKYKGVQVDVLEGHIHEFKGTFIAIPIPTNHMVFNKRFSANELRARLQKFTIAQRVFEAAGDASGDGELSIEVKRGATGTLEDREGSVKVTRAYGLEPGVKKIIHAYHPKFPSGDDPDNLPSRLERLWDTYTTIFDTAYADENFVLDMKIAISPLSTELQDWRSPQPRGTVIALKAIGLFINNLIKKRLRNISGKEPPAQIAIILPPPEGEDVRADKRDEAFRLELVQHFVTELPKHLEYSLAPSGVNETPVSPVAPAAPATTSDPSGGPSGGPSSGSSGAASSTVLTGRRTSDEPSTGRSTAAPIDNPPLSPLTISEHSSPEANNDHEAGDQPDDDNNDGNDKSTPDPDGEEGEEEGEEEEDHFVEAAPLPKSTISRRYKGVLIELCAGDIAHFPSANPKGPPYARILVADAAIELDGKSGPDDVAIYAAAGPLLRAALTDLKKRDGYVNERTRVWTTGSYNLGLIGVRRIIHAIGPLYHPRASDKSNDKTRNDLYHTYHNTLYEAVKPENVIANMMVAFSLLSTNKNNFPYAEAMRIALEEVMKFILHGNVGGINHVVFVVPRKNDDRVKPFEDAMRKIFDEEEAHEKNEESSEVSDSDSDDEDSNGGEGPSNPNARTTRARKSKQEKSKTDTDKNKKTERADKKKAKEAAAAAARESDARARLLRDQLRETFKVRAVESAIQIAARQKAPQAEESKRMREELKKNLDDLYNRIGEGKKKEREKKHAERAAAEKVKEKGKDREKGKRIPAAKRSPIKKSPAKKIAEEPAAAESSSDEEEFFLAPEQITDTGIGTRSKTREKRSREDVEERQVASKQAKRLKKKSVV